METEKKYTITIEVEKPNPDDNKYPGTDVIYTQMFITKDDFPLVDVIKAINKIQ